MPATASTVVTISINVAKACAVTGTRIQFPAASLVAKRLDRVHGSGLPGWVDAEDEADEAGDNEGDGDPHRRKRRVQEGDGIVQNQRKERSGQNADDPAHHA